jgi:hypothetical protein
VALGGCPFEDQMRLDIWNKAQRTTTLMIRCFIDTYVDIAWWVGHSCERVSYSRESSTIILSKAYAGRRSGEPRSFALFVSGYERLPGRT